MNAALPVTAQFVRVNHADGSKTPVTGDYVRHVLGFYFRNVHERMERLHRGERVDTTSMTFELRERPSITGDNRGVAQ